MRNSDGVSAAIISTSLTVVALTNISVGAERISYNLPKALLGSWGTSTTDEISVPKVSWRYADSSEA